MTKKGRLRANREVTAGITSGWGLARRGSLRGVWNHSPVELNKSSSGNKTYD